MKILIDHIGYEIDSIKIALLAFTKERVVSEKKDFTVLLLSDSDHTNLSDQVILTGVLGTVVQVSGWKDRFFQKIDFSSIHKKGRYRIKISIGKETCESSSFQIGQGLLADNCISDILFYFKSQRCSWRWDQADSNIPFFGDRKDNVDVHGGWYDASGDYSKYLSHLSYANYFNPQQTPLVVWALFSLHETVSTHPHYKHPLLEDRILEEAFWGTDFLMRMKDPEGFFYTTVFDQWSKKTEKRMIAAFRGQEGTMLDSYQAGFRQGGGLAIAALARASSSGSHGEYTTGEYLDAAIKGWEHLQRYGLTYLDNKRENIIDDYSALLAVTEIYRATEDRTYLEAARERAGNLIKLYNHDRGYWQVEKDNERPFFHASDSGLPLVAIIAYENIETDARKKNDTAAFIRIVSRDLLAVADEVDNPFNLARQWIEPLGGKAHSSFFMPHVNETGYWWQGENASIASLSCALRLAKDYFTDTMPEMIPKLDYYADSQLHWILGRNPFDICMLQGRGRNNPNYEEYYPNAPGGICNGITAGFTDEDDIDFLPDTPGDISDHKWRWSEQWIPHAAWFLLALTANSKKWRQEPND